MTTGHLDAFTIRELKSVMGGDFAQLVRAFITDSHQRLAAIAAAVDSGDAEALRRSAHSFKGSAGNMGAPMLLQLCQALEQSGACGELAGCADLYRELHDEFAGVEREMLQLIG
jgi:HPt (histidine-containing phosphotransfer) domain-containing protein